MNFRLGFLFRFGILPSLAGLATLCIQPIIVAQQAEIRQLEEFLTPEPLPPARVYHPPSRPWRPAPTRPNPSLSGPEVLSLNSHRPGTLGRYNQLRDGFYQDLYEFQGVAGQTIALNLLGSSDPRMRLDPLLKLIGPDGSVVAEDDNSGNDPNRGDARIVLALPETGTYTIVVTTATPADKGRYALGLQEY